MKEIRRFEELIKAAQEGKRERDDGINLTLFWAYRGSKEAGNEQIDFSDVIWDYDIEAIVGTLRSEGITTFTISSSFSSLVETLAAFEKAGAFMAGLAKVKARYTDWRTGEAQIIPAIQMEIR